MAEAGNQEFTTIIGKDAKFKGDLSFEKGMRLHGELSGTVRTQGQLHIASGAKLDAEVEAGSVIIEGEVKGPLTANDRIELKRTAVYQGDLTASKLVVEEEAQFSGHVSVGPNAVKGRPQGQRSQAMLGANLPPAQAQGQPVK